MLDAEVDVLLDVSEVANGFVDNDADAVVKHSAFIAVQGRCWHSPQSITRQACSDHLNAAI
jgi:hypothetical protein